MTKERLDLASAPNGGVFTELRRAYAEIDALRALVERQRVVIAKLDAAAEAAIVDVALAVRGDARVGEILRALSAARAAPGKDGA
jgi:hypothetical protein